MNTNGRICPNNSSLQAGRARFRLPAEQAFKTPGLLKPVDDDFLEAIAVSKLVKKVAHTGASGGGK